MKRVRMVTFAAPLPVPHRPDCPGAGDDECSLGTKRSNAGFCRLMGWQPGTVIVGSDRGYGESRRIITAIGEQAIIARDADEPNGREFFLGLGGRCWTAMLTKSGAL